MQHFGLLGRVVCVTGGASGIGLAAVRALAADGALPFIIDLKEDEVGSALDEARSAGVKAGGAALDVRDKQALEQAAQTAEADLGPIYGLIASAGTSGANPAEAIEEDDWSRVLGVNATGLFLTCQTFGKRMITHHNGAIVTIGSIDGISGHPGRTHYVASKYAVSGITINLALEWGRFGIRVNCLAPNFVDTPLLRRGAPPRFIKDVVEDRTPLGRMASAEEIASAAMLFLSDAASYITGTVIPIDGGLSAGHFTRRCGADLSSNRLLDAGIYSEI